VRVKILEIDSERRRLSLSIKRVEGQVLPVRPIIPPAEAGDLENVPELGLSEDVFADVEPPAPPAADTAAGAEVEEEVPVDEETPRAAASAEPTPEAPADDEEASDS
jgi:small subunit ribosomal protein S1